MMTTKRTKRRASTKGSVKTKKEEFKGAFIVPAELGMELINTLGEMPMKYSQVLGPLLSNLQRCYRSDVILDVPVEIPTGPIPRTPADKPMESKSDE